MIRSSRYKEIESKKTGERATLPVFLFVERTDLPLSNFPRRQGETYGRRRPTAPSLSTGRVGEGFVVILVPKMQRPQPEGWGLAVFGLVAELRELPLEAMPPDQYYDYNYPCWHHLLLY
jgi:hypothetical protein